ncbi:hypothetical protein CLOACE_03660 [Clostridium acetireducens DSM 10703]|jgi:hypothetical protein|uniref:DUF4342 domain-containing protein n=1 Tax=Clostridium acetireducens DSM 10703 TaxID=1121290 RepID=A0A1E8F161_9CLOT|nr:DUF4342 domain-containing protein [Clostridium acetireducens]OFI07175.1 hypothetical protein CLOACE_03660 [Clostridium acetireducens DSM 10703]
MNEINLEKIDIIRERTGVNYSEAKEALEVCNGNVVDALIYIEQNKKSGMENLYATKDEFINWLKDIVKKGNVNRIRIKKDNRLIVDIPINAGVAATLTALIWPPLIAIGVLTAIVTKLTIEITKEDGSVEVVNKIIKNTVNDVKEKAKDIKDKFENQNQQNQKFDEENAFKYTVNFDDMDSKKNNNTEENEE